MPGQDANMEMGIINPFMPNGLFLPSLFGPAHFQYKGCPVIFYYYHVL